MTPARWHCEWAWLPDGVAADVLIEVEDGRFTTVTPGTPPDGLDAQRLPGITLPGLANAHSHAFHRALRGRTQGGRGTFWTWREQMYSVAGALDPDSYHRLARAVYAEMALAGITCVGEFHYLHHGPGGTPYADPNAMGEALIAAAVDAGIRITLLDTLYLTSTVDGRPLEGIQRRFGDAGVDGWAARVARLGPRPHARIGAAAHSVRAVPAAALGEFARHSEGLPTHVHLSEQRAENDACLAVHGRTPTELLADRGLTGPTVTAVHATHLTDADRAELGDSGTGVCFCPTTERDLADGIGHARALLDAGSPLSLGSDSHAVIDLFEEARGVEMHERLHTEHRGHFTGAELLTAATTTGHACLGWTDAGSIIPGARADLVTVSLTSPRTAGCAPEAVLFAATAADVRHVVVDGRVVVDDGVHLTLPEVGAALAAAVQAVNPSAAAQPSPPPAAPAPSSAQPSLTPATPPTTTPPSPTPPAPAPPSPTPASLTPPPAPPTTTQSPPSPAPPSLGASRTPPAPPSTASPFPAPLAPQSPAQPTLSAWPSLTPPAPSTTTQPPSSTPPSSASPPLSVAPSSLMRPASAVNALSRSSAAPSLMSTPPTTQPPPPTPVPAQTSCPPPTSAQPPSSAPPTTTQPPPSTPLLLAPPAPLTTAQLPPSAAPSPTTPNLTTPHLTWRAVAASPLPPSSAPPHPGALAAAVAPPRAVPSSGVVGGGRLIGWQR